jgi:hypothetical protein
VICPRMCPLAGWCGCHSLQHSITIYVGWKLQGCKKWNGLHCWGLLHSQLVKALTAWSVDQVADRRCTTHMIRDVQQSTSHSYLSNFSSFDTMQSAVALYSPRALGATHASTTMAATHIARILKGLPELSEQ